MEGANWELWKFALFWAAGFDILMLVIFTTVHGKSELSSLEPFNFGYVFGCKAREDRCDSVLGAFGLFLHRTVGFLSEKN